MTRSWSSSCCPWPRVMEKPSEDGYNWRKYGQKQVKGSECPRGYYKCTSRGCYVRKKVEHSYDGHITAIIYKGDHNHPKPPASCARASSCRASTNCTGTSSSYTSICAGAGGSLSGVAMVNERNHAYEHSADMLSCSSLRAREGSADKHALQVNVNHMSRSREYYNSAAVDLDPGQPAAAGGGSTEPYASSAGSDSTCRDEDDDDVTEEELLARSERAEPFIRENSSMSRRPYAWPPPQLLGTVRREPRVVLQTTSDVDILDDGYRWRKYGQKVVKGNPHPRSYYKCTNVGCTVRKHVERSPSDPTAVKTTYQGKHNHVVPAAIAHAAALLM